MKLNRAARGLFPDKSLRSEDGGNALLATGLVNLLLAIVIGVVALQFLGDNAPGMVDDVANTTAAIADADFGSEAANSVGEGISILIPVAFVLGIVGLITVIVAFKKK